MNTSILKDAKYKDMVQETIKELEEVNIENEIEKCETFILTIKSKSISYSKVKSKIKRNLKDKITKEIYKIEEIPDDLEKDHILAQYTYLRQKLKQIEEFEIEGYKRRVKYLASYEKAEPDIAFYSKLEEKKIAKDIIGQLSETKDSEIYTDKENIMKIATKYYSDLYTPSKTNRKTQDKLLRNIQKKITQEQKEKLDAPITIDEIKTAIFQIKPGKSPGLDGIPAEFYQEYWNIVKDIYKQTQNSGISKR